MTPRICSVPGGSMSPWREILQGMGNRSAGATVEGNEPGVQGNCAKSDDLVRAQLSSYCAGTILCPLLPTADALSGSCFLPVGQMHQDLFTPVEMHRRRMLLRMPAKEGRVGGGILTRSIGNGVLAVRPCHPCSWDITETSRRSTMDVGG